MLLFGHNSAPQAKIFVSHIKYFQGGICDPFTPDTEIECDQKRPDSQKKCDGWGVDGGGMGTEQFERHISGMSPTFHVIK